MEKVYLKLLALIVYFCVSIGVVLPFLLSAVSDELVVGGFVYIFTMPFVLGYLIKSIIGEKKV